MTTEDEFTRRATLLRDTMVKVAHEQGCDSEMVFAALVAFSATLIYDIADGDHASRTSGLNLFVADVLKAFDYLDQQAPGRLH